MKRAVLLALLLSGCVTEQDRFARDDAECLGYGVPRGSDAYVSCRTNKERNRTALRASDPNGGGFAGGFMRGLEGRD